MNNINKENRVIIAMSGGVDSSVAAYLLKKQGYNAVGVFMRFWAEPRCSLEAEKAARSICKKIGIPFYTLNLEAEFKKAVVDYFLQELARGNTPNPCVACNKEIKFKFLLEKANELDADFIATGHYARIKREISNLKSQISNKLQITKTKNYEYRLIKAKDKNKDQSYFLYNITQGALARCLFPIGDYLKPEVRKIAKQLKFPSAEKTESQEICFIADNDMERFIRKNLDLAPGKIVDTLGKIIGSHYGLPIVTIGQRHGLGIGGGKPYYVVGKNYKTNQLIVTANPEDKLLYRKKLIAKNVNWISGKAPAMPLKCEVSVRYRQKPSEALIKRKSARKYEVIFARPERAITPGQSVVFYKGPAVLGGGIISF